MKGGIIMAWQIAQFIFKAGTTTGGKNLIKSWFN